MMEYLRKNYAVLFSPKFHGLVLYTVLTYIQAKGLIVGAEVELLSRLVGLATGVGVAESMARKIGKKK